MRAKPQIGHATSCHWGACTKGGFLVSVAGQSVVAIAIASPTTSDGRGEEREGGGATGAFGGRRCERRERRGEARRGEHLNNTNSIHIPNNTNEHNNNNTNNAEQQNDNHNGNENAPPLWLLSARPGRRHPKPSPGQAGLRWARAMVGYRILRASFFVFGRTTLSVQLQGHILQNIQFWTGGCRKSPTARTPSALCAPSAGVLRKVARLGTAEPGSQSGGEHNVVIFVIHLLYVCSFVTPCF